MTIGKNKRLTRGKAGKGAKKKVMDPFIKKDWYNVRAPATFDVRDIGKTPVNKSSGTKHSSDSLRGRVFEISLGDLSTANNENVFRKFRLIAEEIDDKSVLTNFHGMTLTSDKLKSMVKKNQTTIEAYADVKTTDGYLLRLFCIGFTHKPEHQAKKTCYAKTSKCKAIRRKMVEIMTKEISTVDLKQVINKLIPDSIASDITKQCGALFPMKDVAIRKVKVLKRPKADMSKLMDMHGDSGKTGMVSGEIVGRDGYEPPIQESV